MLDVVTSAPRNAVTAGFDVEILSLATANPPHLLTQADATVRAQALFPHLKKMWRLYENTCIATRYNCEQIEWYLDRSRCDFGILTNGRLWRLVPRDIERSRARPRPSRLHRALLATFAGAAEELTVWRGLA